MIGKNKINKETFDQLNRRFNWLRKQYREYQEPMNPVKTYKAIVNERTTVVTNSGLLVTGKMYIIYSLEAGDNFANVGYVNDDVAFIATGTTPTTWTNSTQVINITDSVIDTYVLEDTFNTPINIIFPFNINSNGEFTIGKTFILSIKKPDGKTLPNNINYNGQDDTFFTDLAILIEVYP